MTNSLHQQKIQKKNQSDNKKKRHQTFDNTTIADRHRTISWSNDNH